MDFKKAFDSVWHDVLFYGLLDYGIGGNIYKLIKSLYSKSFCAVRLNRSKTDSFSYGRGVRQGCILSQLLFNLFINELPSSFDYAKTDPIPLPNNTELNNLSYTDDFGFNFEVQVWLRKLFKNTRIIYCKMVDRC